MTEPRPNGCTSPCIACMTDESHDPAPAPLSSRATKPAEANAPTADRLRADLLHALDFAYCTSAGYETPEQMLDAYDAARAAERPAPADRAAEVEELRATVAQLRAEVAKEKWARGEGREATARLRAEVKHLQDDALNLRAERAELRDLLRAEGARAADAIQREEVAEQAVLEAPADRAAVLREAADRLDRLGLRDLATRELRRMADEAEYVATPCSEPVHCKDGEEFCEVHERLVSHQEGCHELCAPGCDDEESDGTR